jgi:uncharacterized linocin/CFP29 family protein
MAESNMQLQWGDEQWNKVRQVVYEEARRARVAGNVLPLFGPLESDAKYVAKQALLKDGDGFKVEDSDSLKLLTIQERVYLRGAQVADPDLDSALIAFRRAANVLARREDEIIFNGGTDDEGGAGGMAGLVSSAKTKVRVVAGTPPVAGEALVSAISRAIGKLETKHHLGPFACLLGQEYFGDVQTPTSSMVLPQDRILPFLGGGALLRTSVLGPQQGLVIALGGAPIDLVVATDISVAFLQITTYPYFVFRVYEKFVLRVKQPEAIARLGPDEDDNEK